MPDPALTVPHREAILIADEDVARLLAYVGHHLNVEGHCSFQLPELAGARRALRDPDTPDDSSA